MAIISLKFTSFRFSLAISIECDSIIHDSVISHMVDDKDLLAKKSEIQSLTLEKG
jgi:hypothetical protein